MPDAPDAPLPGDPQRQADATLRAYQYQIWLTVLAWLQLEPDQRLWVEQAEDFDVTGPTGAAAVQVSHSTRRITLRDDKVREAIANFWRLRENASDRSVRFRYLTRGEPGVEAGQPFGASISGISQWAVAARDAGTAAKVLDFLRLERGHYPATFQTFLDRTSPADAMGALFVPLTFELGAGDTATVQRAIDVQLALAAEASGIMPAAALRTRPALFARVCAVAARPGDRWLTRVELRVELAAAAAVVMRPEFERALQQTGELNASVRELLGRLFVSEAVTGTPLPPPRECVRRESVLRALRDRLRECQVVFAQGSAGMGKTTLAKFFAAQEPGVWQWVSMAGLHGEAVVQKLRAVGARVASDAAAPRLIMDDVDVSAPAQGALDDALSVIAVLLRQRGGEMLITTQAVPGTRLIDACGAEASPIFAVPGMTEEETRDLAALLGCPEGELLDLWGRFARRQSHGHPQLARAVLIDGKARNWAASPAGAGASASRANTVRAEARQLVAALPEPEKELLFRLSLVGGGFRREHVLRIASEPPPLVRPGEAFDLLVGAWVEALSATTYRVSPLLMDAATEIYDPATVRRLRVGIARTLIQGNPSPSEGALAFRHVWEAKDGSALRGLTLSLIHQRADALGPMALHLAWFVAEGPNPGEVLFPDDPHLSASLRWLQFYIAAEIVPARAANVLRSWLAETERLPEPDARWAAKFLAVSEGLRRPAVPLPARDVVEYLGLLFDARDRREAVYVLAEGGMGDLDAEIATGIDHSDFVELQTVFSLNRCQSVPWLDEWLTVVGSLDEGRRERLLSIMRRNAWWCGLMVDAAWLDEELKTTPDWARCLRVLDRTRMLATGWNVPGLVVSAVRATATIRDEYQHEPRAALQELDAFLAAHRDPPPRLLDARAAILFHLGDYRAAVAVWDALLPTWRPENPEDRYPAFASRTRAIALSHLEDFAGAARGFIDARDRLPRGGESPQDAGLLADAALCWWKAGERGAALSALVEAVRAADRLPTGYTDLLAFRMSRVIGHIVSVLHHRVTDWVVENQVEPPIGFASDLAAPDRFRELQEGPFEYVWDLLVRLGNALDRDIEIPAATGRPPLENRAQTISCFYAARTAIETACRRGNLADLPRLAAALDQEWIKVQEILREIRANGNVPPRPVPVPTGWCSEIAGAFLLRVGLVVAAARGTLQETIDAWRADPVTLPWDDTFRAWLDASRETFRLPLHEACRRLRENATALSMDDGVFTAARVAADAEAAPADSARSQAQLLFALAPSFWRIASGFALSDLFARIWRRHAANTALLYTPRLTVPPLLAACDVQPPGFAPAAGIVLAALPTVDVKLAANLRHDLRLLRENEMPLGRTPDPFAAFAPSNEQDA